DAVIDLQPLELSFDGRRKAFAEAVDDLAARLPGIPLLRGTDWRNIAHSVGPPEDLGHPRYEAVLRIHMAALAALLQAAEPKAAETGGLLEDVLLDHEQH